MLFLGQLNKYFYAVVNSDTNEQIGHVRDINEKGEWVAYCNVHDYISERTRLPQYALVMFRKHFTRKHD